MESRTEQHTSEGSPDRGPRGNLAVPVALALAVGALWYLLLVTGVEGLLPLALTIVTLGLAVGFGLSMARTQGFVMSVAIAASVVTSAFLVEGSLSENPEDGYVYLVLFAVVVTIFVLTCWLIGAVIGWMCHGSVGRHDMQAHRQGRSR